MKNGRAASPVASSRRHTNNHAQHGAQHHGHEHGPNGCCGHDHGRELCCEMAIRDFRDSDYRALRNIWKLGDIALDDTDSAKTLAHNLTTLKTSFRVFVAEAQIVDLQLGEKVGKPRLAGGVIFTCDGRRGYVYHFAVHPEFRGVGVGGALLETCERQARAWGHKHLRLTARNDSSRAAARKLYQEMGWEPHPGLTIYGKALK